MMPLKVTFLSLHGDPLAPLGGSHHGGQNVYVKELSSHLTELGVGVDVYSRWESSDQPSVESIAEGARVIRVKVGPPSHIQKEEILSLLPDIARWISQFWKENQPSYDLIHSHYYFSGAVAIYLKDIWRMPLCHTYHSLGAVKEQALGSKDPSPKQRIKIEGRISQGADRIIATAPQEKSDLRRLYQTDPSKVDVVPCGVNLELFHPIPQEEARREIGFSPRDFLITFVGRLEERKGIDTLLEAVHIVNNEKIQVVIVGGPPTKKDFLSWTELGDAPYQKYRRLLEEYDLVGQVTFTGGKPQQMLAQYYSAADVTVIPSYYEPFGMTAIEALACGSSLIASKVGGLKTTVKEDHVGLLFEPRDPHHLADQIQRLMSYPPLNEKFRNNARAYVEEHFSWRAVAEKIAAIYKGVVSK
jgi:D-inositol-3-phosphate glycosyltransferase